MIKTDKEKLVSFRRNIKLDSIEFEFDEKPSDNLRILLRDNGFSWSSKNKVWYRKFSSNAEQSANLILEKLKLIKSIEAKNKTVKEIDITQHKTRRNIDSNIKFNVWRKYNGDSIVGKCYVCGLAIDINHAVCAHVTAVVNGGSDDISNLRPTCSGCNSGMKTMNLEEYKNRHFSSLNNSKENLITIDNNNQNKNNVVNGIMSIGKKLIEEKLQHNKLKKKLSEERGNLLNPITKKDVLEIAKIMGLIDYTEKKIGVSIEKLNDVDWKNAIINNNETIESFLSRDTIEFPEYMISIENIKKAINKKSKTI